LTLKGGKNFQVFYPLGRGEEKLKKALICPDLEGTALNLKGINEFSSFIAFKGGAQND
jgi:hypothetical protein